MYSNVFLIILEPLDTAKRSRWQTIRPDERPVWVVRSAFISCFNMPRFWVFLLHSLGLHKNCIGRKDLVTYNQQSHSIIALKVQGPGSWARHKELPCWLSPAVFSSLTSLSPSGYSPRALGPELTTNKPLYVHLPRLCLHRSVCVECLYPAIHPHMTRSSLPPSRSKSPSLWILPPPLDRINCFLL